MAIAQLSQRIPSANKPEGEWTNRAESLESCEHWMRSLAVTSLITGAVLLARGRRKAGLVVSAAGTAMALLENPNQAASFWQSIPSRLQSGKRLLSQAEGFVEEMEIQKEKFFSLLDRARLRS